MGDGQYELQLLVRLPLHASHLEHSSRVSRLQTCDTYVLAVENMPDVRGYSTKDLWVKHPTKEGLWRIVGRLDDVIILANGEKTVPGPQEAIISSSPLVQGAVMFGREHNQVGVLIEPSHDHAVDPQDEVALAKLRNALW
jgi:acyl-CoA synthetase (AMP-forming)/AMP-acid ligase II